MLSIAPVDRLVEEGNLFDYFRSRVQAAVQRRRAPVTENTVFYLSELLTEQGHREAEPDAPTTLVELQQRAAGATFPEAVRLWKRLGDESLMALGFFREQLDRRRISRDYYAEMGRGAYARLGRLLRDPSGQADDLFGDLADQYPACTEVIAEVREEARECNATDIVRLYEEWLQTGSPRLADRLRTLGLVPVRAGGQG